MMSNNWKKFIVVVLALFSFLFIYGVSIPEVRNSIGTTSIITTFIGIASVLYFVFKKQNTAQVNYAQTEDKSQKLAANVVKVAVVFVAFVVVYLLYTLATGDI